MREKLSMDFAWRFHKDDIKRPEITEMMFYYHHTKAERGVGPAAPSFYDMDWEIVDLPHDYAVELPPDFTYTNSTGFNRRCNGWYRRLFALGEEDRGRRILVQFDGVSSGSTVYVNGHLVHRNFSGYTSFAVDITDFVDYGERLNQISVYVDTSFFEGWWYEGAGIYRHVYLIKTADVAVDTWGVYVHPSLTKGGQWEVPVETTLKNIAYDDRLVTLDWQVLDGDGQCVGQTSTQAVVPMRNTACIQSAMTVDDPKLWSIDNPNLYTLRATVIDDQAVIDRYDTTFGFRTIRYSADEGFFLNEKPVKIKGVCAHDDQANLGVALPDAIHEERIRFLKSIGCNGYRCSHNAPAPETLDACDRLGMVVMDENRWFDSSVQGLDDLAGTIRRDRNHPCIIMWSMANEEPIQGTERGGRIFRAMRHQTRLMDNTRPVMMAICNDIFSQDSSENSDIIGINYNANMFDALHERFPNTPLVASEIGGKMLPLGIMGDGSGEDWEAVDTRPFFMGMFKWVAFGYRGESRAWPRLYSRSGIVEPTCTPRENTFFYKQMWDDAPFVKMWPIHWNWEGKEQEEIAVKVYTNAEEAELFLNGQSLGRRAVNRYRRTTWQIPFVSGTLRAVAYRDGRAAAEETMKTTGKPAAVCLQASRSDLNANRTDIVTVTATVADAQGIEAQWSKADIDFSVDGPATILAVSNGDPYETLGPKVPQRKLFLGICQLVLRTQATPGTITITAKADGLQEAKLSLEVKPCTRALHVAIDTETDSLYYFAKMSGAN